MTVIPTETLAREHRIAAIPDKEVAGGAGSAPSQISISKAVNPL